MLVLSPRCRHSTGGETILLAVEWNVCICWKDWSQQVANYVYMPDSPQYTLPSRPGLQGHTPVAGCEQQAFIQGGSGLGGPI
jgi:hypothetical protein